MSETGGKAFNRDDRQVLALAWVRDAFGPDTVRQRALRFLEESIELYQAAGGDEKQALRLVLHVFDRPAGELAQEVGGVGLTLLALCGTAALSADEQELLELARVRSMPLEHFRARNAAKDAAGFRATDSPEASRR